MSKKAKLFLLALLGFSTACSTVKNGSKADKKRDKENKEAAVENVGEAADERPQIRVLYGVRPPVPLEEVEQTPAPENADEQK